MEKILLPRNKTRYRRLYNRLAGFIHPFSMKKLLPCPHFIGNCDFPFSHIFSLGRTTVFKKPKLFTNNERWYSIFSNYGL